MGCFGNADKVYAKEVPITGPVNKRGCTDVFFIPIYLIFVSFLVYILVRATNEGNIDLLIHGSDSYGNICGVKNEPIDGVPLSGQDMRENDHVFIQFVNFTTPVSGSVVLLRRKKCVEKCFENQTKIINRCVSESIKINKGPLSSFISASSDFFEDVGEDADRCWREIVYLVIIALLLSFLLLVMLRFVSGIIIWTILFAVLVCCIAATVVSWLKYVKKKQLLEELGTLQPKNIVLDRNMWLGAAIIMTIVTVVIIFVILVMRKRIQLVIALFREASKAVIKIPFLMVLPLITFCFVCLTFTMWFIGLLYIVSARDPFVHSDGSVEYRIKDFFKRVRLYHFLFMIWNVQFIIACQHMVVAGAVSRWYFTKDKSKLETPLASSLLTLLRYHLGSTLMGSFIIAVVKFIRFLLKKYTKSIKGIKWSSCIKVASCCLWLIEKILDQLNRTAYAEICIYGENFCSSAKRAFNVMAKNILRLFAINSIGDFVLFLSKLGLTLGTFFIGQELVESKEDMLNYSWVPATIGAIFAYIISLAFLSIYEMTIDTIFVCFCEDCEQNNGQDKPYYMSKELMVFVDNCKKDMKITEEVNNVDVKGSQLTKPSD